MINFPEAFAARDTTIHSLTTATIEKVENLINTAARNGLSVISGSIIEVEKTDTASAIEVLLKMYGYADINVRPMVDFNNREQYKMMLSFNWNTPVAY